MTATRGGREHVPKAFLVLLHPLHRLLLQQVPNHLQTAVGCRNLAHQKKTKREEEKKNKNKKEKKKKKLKKREATKSRDKHKQKKVGGERERERERESTEINVENR